MTREPTFGLEAAFALVLLVSGGLIAYVSWGYGFGSMSRPGPGLYPFFVGIAIAVAALFTLVGTLRSSDAHPGSRFRGATHLRDHDRNVLLLDPRDAGPRLRGGHTHLHVRLRESRRLEGWRKPLAVAVGTAAFIWLLFDVWLYIDLPRGISDP